MPTLGLRHNWRQFALLVLINAFVGGMVGLERSIFPRFASEQFGVESSSAVLSFIAAFGLAKAVTNYFTGRLAARWGRRNLLIFGWLLAVPIPFVLILADAWAWVVLANILLGMSQGLAWSSTVVMKIDLVGERERGLAMGFNEFAGYLSVGLMAWLSGWIADAYGVHPYPFYVGIGLAAAGLLLSVGWARDTSGFVKTESQTANAAPLDRVFWETTWRNPALGSVSQAGLINNLNDGMIWGLWPMLLAGLAFSTQSIGAITAIYPAVWGLGQLFTGRLADIWPHKWLIFWGMSMQAAAILCLPLAADFSAFAAIAAVLGIGTALVYPTFLVAVAAHSHPSQRAESLGIFRFWRDLGYVLGALLAGLVADVWGVSWAILATGVLTALSALIAAIRMPRR